jgi:probable phosphoglycerate mutase
MKFAGTGSNPLRAGFAGAPQPESRNMTRLCLVRHGETDWNVQRRIQGHIDIPLNPGGIEQAAAAARGIQAIYSSDLTRARQTAATIALELGLDVRSDAQLRERRFGIFEGLTYDDAKREHSALYARFETRDTAFAVPGGESLLELAARVEAMLRRIVHQHPGQTVLVVTHGGVLDIAHRLATNRPLGAPRDFLIGNATYNWIDWQGEGAEGRFVLRAWGESMHLDETLDELPG